MPLTGDAPLQGVIDGRYLKSSWLHDGDTNEPVLQTYAVPVSAFLAANQDLRLEELDVLSVRFGEVGDGAVLIGDLGITGPLLWTD